MIDTGGKPRTYHNFCLRVTYGKYQGTCSCNPKKKDKKQRLVSFYQIISKDEIEDSIIHFNYHMRLKSFFEVMFLA